MLSWPSATARVVWFDPGIDPTFMGSWYANPKVRFEYEVAGTRFEGSTLNPSPFNYQSPSRFRAETNGLKPGALVPCWYDPQRPANGYLINTGITTAPVVLVSAGLVSLSLVAFARVRRRDGGDGRTATA